MVWYRRAEQPRVHNATRTWTEEADFGGGFITAHVLEQDDTGAVRCRTCEDFARLNDTERLSEQQRRRREAADRARALLHDVLSVEQRRSLEHNGWFEVRKDNRVFRIHNGGSQNIQEMWNGRPVRTYCIIPQAPVPIADILVSQKMLLEADLELFEHTAVVSGPPPALTVEAYSYGDTTFTAEGTFTIDID